MATRSVFDELDNQGAVLDVPRGQVLVLRPQDSKSAIGTQRFSGHAYLVLMGTSPKSAVMMAYFDCFNVGRCSINTVPGSEEERSFLTEMEADYMSLLRKAVKLFLDEHDLFQLPLAWIVLRHDDNPALSALLQEKTLKVFQHLRIQTGVSIYDEPIMEAASLQPPKRTVFAIRHGSGMLEIHVGDRLVYPKVHPGSLALSFDKLGTSQVDNERKGRGVHNHYSCKGWSGT